MRIEGHLLNFEKNDGFGFRFSKDCKIDIPEGVPIFDRFSIPSANSCIGFANVTRDNAGLDFTGEIFVDASTLVKGVGGYFDILKTEKNGEMYDIKQCKLRAIGTTDAPVSKDYYWKEDKNAESEV